MFAATANLATDNKVTMNSIAKVTNSIANGTKNSIAKVTNSIANSIAKTCNNNLINTKIRWA